MYLIMTKIRHKRDSFNVIPQILDEKMIYNIKIKFSYSTRIIDPSILNICPIGYSEPLYLCDQSVITLGTRKRMTGFCNTDHVDTSYRCPIDTTSN